MESGDIAVWLRGLGLGQYQEAFAKNSVDAGVLLELTAEDLKELGVEQVGHRRKILAAIAALRAASAESTGSSPRPSALSREAERRQLSVMFCDLVGSTALSRRFDPEDLREIIGVYHRCVAGTVARFGGFVAKYMGDGVLVYFGYPQAHEDDAERAVRGGLAVIDAVGALAAPEPLKVRLGVASGIVVVGDLIGEGEARERGIVGETPNLAARLQVLAAPDTLVVAESTRRQIGALFQIEDLGPRQLAGFAEPQQAWNRASKSPARKREQKKRWFRNGQKWRTGCEGRISVIKRRHGLARSRYQGDDGMKRWVGLGVIADNLVNIGRALAKPPDAKLRHADHTSPVRRQSRPSK